jgi:DMSO/TMAO reductase YedYZ molybdopterin-dependent catalytic subunit
MWLKYEPACVHRLRAVISGLYGMMSAKFLNKIELVASPYDGYWQSRGWSKIGAVQTASFINIPGDGASISLAENNGSIIMGGAAYAGD